MEFTTAIKDFFDSQAGQLAIWVLILPVLDFVLGIAAAVRDNTFQLDSVAAFLRKHVAGRILPIWALLFVGYFSENIQLPVTNWSVFLSIGVASAGLYLAETVGSILRSWGPSTGPGLLTRDAAQPVPQD